jgi:hypothetical protein
MDNRNIALVMTDLNTGVGVDDLALTAVTGHSLTPLLSTAGVRTATLDGDSGAELPTVRASHHLLSDSAVAESFEQWGIRAIIPFKTSRRVEQQASVLGVRVLAPPATIARRLENKLELPALARAAGVMAPTTWPISVHETGYQLTGDAGPAVRFPAVLQPSVGFAGQGTIPVDDEAGAHEAARLAARRGRDGDLAKLTQRIVGIPLTVSGCALADGTILTGGVARQLTGIPELSNSPFTSCGNDWDPSLSGELITQARQAAAQVGAAAHKMGHVGMFGVDLIAADDGTMVLIEVNPRWTASLAFGLALQADGGNPTLLHALAHAFPDCGPWSEPALSRAGQAVERYSDPTDSGDVQPKVAGASVLLFSRQKASFRPAPLPPGLYQNDPFLRVRESEAAILGPLLQGQGTGTCGPEQAVIIPRPPSAPVDPDSSLCRVLLVGRTSGTSDGRGLQPATVGLISKLEQALV